MPSACKIGRECRSVWKTAWSTRRSEFRLGPWCSAWICPACSSGGPRTRRSSRPVAVYLSGFKWVQGLKLAQVKLSRQVKPCICLERGLQVEHMVAHAPHQVCKVCLGRVIDYELMHWRKGHFSIRVRLSMHVAKMPDSRLLPRYILSVRVRTAIRTMPSGWSKNCTASVYNGNSLSLYCSHMYILVPSNPVLTRARNSPGILVWAVSRTCYGHSRTGECFLSDYCSFYIFLFSQTMGLEIITFI